MVKKTQKKSKKSVNNEIAQLIDVESLNNERLQSDNMPDKLINEEFDIELNSNEPIRELFSAKNVRFKTQLTEEQRGAVSILYHAYKGCLERGISFNGLKVVLDEYIDFGVSVDRKSRQEYVDSQKAQAMNNMMNNNLSKPNDLSNMKA